jgi:glycosyltransferase involved in cell wall biosynthesis
MPVTNAAVPHVLTLTDAIGHGGAERIAVDLAIRLDPGRFRRTLCVTRPPAAAADVALADHRRLVEAGVDVLALDRRSRADVRGLSPLIRRLARGRVDVIHAHKFGSNVWAALLGRALRVPVVIAHEHTWSFEGQWLRRQLDRHVVGRLADVVVAVSEADRVRMIDTVKMRGDRIVLIPNGISFEADGDRLAVRRELGLDPNAPVLAQTAVLRPQKAIGVMLEAMALVRRSHPVARLLVIGPGDTGELQDLAMRLGVAEAVTFMGARSDVPAILGGADVGVLSSDFEGSPLAVLEYMAAGLPVVATDVGGLPQIVNDGVTGLLVPARDPASLATAVCRLLDDERLARRMGEQGRARQRAEFSMDAMTRRVSDLYERLLASRRLERRPGDRGEAV